MLGLVSFFYYLTVSKFVDSFFFQQEIQHLELHKENKNLWHRFNNALLSVVHSNAIKQYFVSDKIKL